MRVSDYPIRDRFARRVMFVGVGALRPDQMDTLGPYTDIPLPELAERFGYLSDTAFSRAFKRHTGVSSGRFRTNKKQTQPHHGAK